MKTMENDDVNISADDVEEEATDAEWVIGFTGKLEDRMICHIASANLEGDILVPPFSCMKSVDFYAFHEYMLRIYH